MNPTPLSVSDLEVRSDALDISRAARIYENHGCLVVRGLMRDFVECIRADIDRTLRESLDLLPSAVEVDEGWRTPNGTLFIPAPPEFPRDKQIMVLGIGYQTSAAFFRSAFHPPLLDVVEAIIGPHIELFMNGQCLVKEPGGGHAKHLHQDGAYFEHRFEGPVACLTYLVDTNLENGALHVVPGSHRLPMLTHIDTPSHLGLDEREWPWDRSLPICGAPGDSIFFHVKTVHGSPENRSRKPRPVFIHRYRRPDDYVIVSATSAKRREEVKRSAHEVRGDQQRGFMVRGYRSFSIPASEV